jgi:2-oxo-4-hydroxy-4-carboxy-5-ureidoimidazoline decarboxylase
VTTLSDLNALPPHAVEPLLAACCGAPGWVRSMLGQRPFASRDALFDASDRMCAKLSHEQWLAAFAHHPRIGEQHAAAAVSETAQQWSEGEQGGAMNGDVAVQDQLREAQRRYEMRFGYIFIICASGRSAPEIMGELQSRLRNDPDTEIRIAAGEQCKITRLRLEKLIGSDEESGA